MIPPYLLPLSVALGYHQPQELTVKIFLQQSAPWLILHQARGKILLTSKLNEFLRTSPYF